MCRFCCHVLSIYGKLKTGCCIVKYIDLKFCMCIIHVSTDVCVYVCVCVCVCVCACVCVCVCLSVGLVVFVLQYMLVMLRLFTCVFVAVHRPALYEREKEPAYWDAQARDTLVAALKLRPREHRAKNLILFLGDGRSSWQHAWCFFFTCVTRSTGGTQRKIVLVIDIFIIITKYR